MPLSSLNETRPWGSFEVLDVQPTHCVKRLVVLPGHRFSLQFHRERSEYWIVVSGTGRATLGDREFQVQAGSVVSVPVETIHRLKCISEEPLIIVEVWTGPYLGEDDIVRLEDDYQRMA